MKSKIFTKILELLRGYAAKVAEIHQNEEKRRAMYTGDYLDEELEKLRKERLAARDTVLTDLGRALNDFQATASAKVEAALTGDKLNSSDMALLSGALDLSEAQLEILFNRHKGNDVMVMALRKYAEDHGKSVDLPLTLDKMLERVTPTLREANGCVDASSMVMAIYEGMAAEADEYAAAIEGA